MDLADKLGLVSYSGARKREVTSHSNARNNSVEKYVEQEFLELPLGTSLLWLPLFLLRSSKHLVDTKTQQTRRAEGGKHASREFLQGNWGILRMSKCRNSFIA